MPDAVSSGRTIFATLGHERVEVPLPVGRLRVAVARVVRPVGRSAMSLAVAFGGGGHSAAASLATNERGGHQGQEGG